MITTLFEFQDASAFERSALMVGFPLMEIRPSTVAQGGLDLRSGTIAIGVGSTENLGAEARQATIDQLRPLFFGAAWKVMDLLAELALSQDGLMPRRQGSWTIDEKVQHLRGFRGRSLPLSLETDLWQRLCMLYSNTVEARHSLVHRRFSLGADGRMTSINDRNGNQMPDLTVEEQRAFCTTALRVGEATIAAVTLDNRDRSYLAWELDQLRVHHGLASLGGNQACPVEIVRVNAIRNAERWVVNTSRAMTEARRVFVGRSFFDIEIHFPNSGLPPITGRLDAAPVGEAVSIDPAQPLNW